MQDTDREFVCARQSTQARAQASARLITLGSGTSGVYHLRGIGCAWGITNEGGPRLAAWTC
jgi:hypothetical protein